MDMRTKIARVVRRYVTHPVHGDQLVDALDELFRAEMREELLSLVGEVQQAKADIARAQERLAAVKDAL